MARKKAAPVKVGILGGGQLARMLALAAHPMGIEPHVLSSHAQDPAAQVSSFWQNGDPNELRDLRKFLRSVDVITFESEFIDAQKLARVAKAVKKPVHPSPQLMGTIQDRFTQKQLLDKHSLKTAPWQVVDSEEDLESAWTRWPQGFVLKQRRDGYDGYGTHVVRRKSHRNEAKTLLSNERHQYLAEEFIPFDREVAIIAARTLTGQVEFMPYVESRQRDSRCDWVKGPLQETSSMKRMKSHLKNFLQKIKYVGVMGIEFFEKEGSLLINELAPRVHNTGHYSQNSLREDQFTWHLKCLLGQELSAAKPFSSFAMANLIGKGGKSLNWPLPTNVHVHWYGKSLAKPGRKMGHLNSLATSPEKALKQCLNARKLFRL